jgi:hypothetical protein
MLDRDETIKFEIVIHKKNLNKKLLKKVQENTITDLTKVDNDSTITYKQNIDINYYNGVLDYLNLILDLIKKADIVKVSTKELKHGKSIIQEALCKLNEIEKRIK